VKILREFRLELSLMVFLLAAFMTILAATWAVPALTDVSPDFVRDLHNRLGAWMVWVAFFGPFILLPGGLFYFADTVRKRREFERLIVTRSKAQFVHHQDRLEYLAYYFLTEEHRQRVAEKKREFKIGK
jgi:hypothetical protein